MELKEKALILDKAGVRRTLTRLANQIVVSHGHNPNIVLVGIRRRGVPIVERIANHIERATGTRPPTGQLDITLYRDDLSAIGPSPVVNRTDFPVNLNGRTVILVDDVLFSGRTVRAALDEIADFGRPEKIQLAVLIDREGLRELPIQADYVGKRLKTLDTDSVQVLLEECDGEEKVVLLERE